MIRLILALAVLGVASPIWAAAGDDCVATGNFDEAGFGNLKPRFCYVFEEDETTAASVANGVVNLDTLATRGVPDVLSIYLYESDCSAGTATFTTSETNGGTEFDLDDPNPALDLSGSGVVRINVPVTSRGEAIGSWLNLSWTGVAGCTNGFDVYVVGYEIVRKTTR